MIGVSIFESWWEVVQPVVLIDPTRFNTESIDVEAVINTIPFESPAEDCILVCTASHICSVAVNFCETSPSRLRGVTMPTECHRYFRKSS